MKQSEQNIHETRTVRAINNIKTMFAKRKGFDFIYTEKEKQMIEDLHPRMHEYAKRY